MHCLLTALGSYGDVYPMIGLGAALRGRGHEVTVVTNPHFAGDVTAAGLDVVGVSTAEDYDRLTRNRQIWNATTGLAVVFREAALELLDELYEVVRRHYRPGETLIAAHGLDLASRVAAETLGAPVASIVYAPLALWSDEAPPRLPAGLGPPWAPRWLHRWQYALADRLVVRRTVLPELEAFRLARGLGLLRGSFFDWYYGVAPPVCLFPDWFVTPDGSLPSDWPAGTVTSGFPLGDGAAGRDARPLDDDLEAFLGRGASDAPIVFTPGSAMRHGQRFFAAAVECCERLGRRGVLLTKYPEQLPQSLPPTVIAPGFTPLGRLLPRCAAFVHHGGIGSSARGLAAGVPQLIQPMAFDQFDNAWRLRRLGVADELAPKRFTGRRAAEKLGRLIASPDVAAATQKWAKRCDPQQAMKTACEVLEQRQAAANG